ncbi:hypothetical protein MCHI_001165 [Candidatus Magnetoovum chiemensis]|nr:hypothetical protein MCHI_001165 [Candidatus Magnetoovum chiemensis]
MDIQQEINVSIMDKFKNSGIDFAYPTQSLFIESQNNKTISSKNSNAGN